MAQSFIFGGDTGLSYESLKKRRELAEAMLAAGSGRAPQNVGEGLTAIGNAIGGRIALNRVNKQEGTYRQQGIDDATAAYGGFGDFGAAAGGMASQPTDMGASGNTSATMPISGGQQGFIDAILPQAIEHGRRIGVDPRIIVAQAAQETGWGKSAPGNNFFGIKSHGKGGGQTFTTHEVINGKRVKMNDSFRQYASPGDSVAGYADFISSNPRYKPFMQAQGLDAQLEALGKSGYATDPNYSRSVGSIARSIKLPSGPQAGLTADDVPKNMVAGMGDAGVGDALRAADAMQEGGGDNLIAIIQQASLPELQAMDPGAMSFEERNAATQRMRELADTMESQIGDQRREDFPNADFPAARDNLRGPTLSGLTARDPRTMTPGERNVITRQMQGMGDDLEQQLGMNRIPTPNPRRPVQEMPIPTPRPNFGRNHGVTSDDLAAAIQNRAAPGGGGIPIPTPRPNQGQYNGVTSDDLASAIQNRPALGVAGIPTPTPRPDPNIVERMGGQFAQPMNSGIPTPTPRPDPRQSNLTADDVPPGMLAGGDNAAIADALRQTTGYNGENFPLVQVPKSGRIDSPPADIQTENLGEKMNAQLPQATGIDPNLMPSEAMQPDQGGNPRDAILQALIKSSGSQQLANADPNSGILAALMGNKTAPMPASAGAFPAAPQAPGQAPIQSSGQGESYFPPAPQAPGQGQQGVGGLDPRLINALSNPFLPAGHKAVLGAMLQQQLAAMQPRSPKEALEIQKLQKELNAPPKREMIKAADGYLYDTATGQRAFPDVQGAPDEPKLVELYSATTGQKYKAKWNKETGEYEPVAGEAIPKEGITIIGPDGTITTIGGSGGSGGKLTVDQGKNTGFLIRTRASNKILNELEEQGTSALGKFLEAVPFGVGNYGQTEEYQKYDQARRDFINAILRRESGAVISPEEFKNGNEQYFPQPGNGPKVIAQKRANRENAIKGLEVGAGPGVDHPAAQQVDRTEQDDDWQDLGNGIRIRRKK